MANTQITSAGVVFPDGSVQTTASNSMKNRIINGAMNINQRKKTLVDQFNFGDAASYNYNDGAYNTVVAPSQREFFTLDRWNGFIGGYFAAYVKQRLQNNSSLQVPKYKYEMVTNFSLDTYYNGTYNVSQKIESIYTQDLVNKTVSLQACLSGNTVNTQKCTWQVWALSSSPIVSGSTVLTDGRPIRDYWGTDYLNSSTYIYQQYGPYYSYLNNATLLKQGCWTISNTATIYSETFQMPNDANIKNGLMITFWPLTAANTSNQMPFQVASNNIIGLLSGDEFRMTGVQFELGTPTSFDYRPVGVEQELCERYCYSFNNFKDSYNNGYYAALTTHSYDAGGYYYDGQSINQLGVVHKIIPNVPMFRTPLFTTDLNGQISGVKPYRIHYYNSSAAGALYWQNYCQYSKISSGYINGISWGANYYDVASNIYPLYSTTQYNSVPTTSSNIASILAYTSNTDITQISLNTRYAKRATSNGADYAASSTMVYNLPLFGGQLMNWNGNYSYGQKQIVQNNMSLNIITEII